MFFSLGQIADLYARTIGAMTEAYVASTCMATNVLFAGIEVTRATINYSRQNTKEASHVLLQMQLKHLPRLLQKKQFKFSKKKNNNKNNE